MKFLHQRKPKQKEFKFLRRRKRQDEPTHDEISADERMKQEWLRQNAITKLPAGWSRYGY